MIRSVLRWRLLALVIALASLSAGVPAVASAAPRKVLFDDLPSRVQPNFVVQSKWNRVHLTYAFLNGTADIPGDDEQQAVRDAMALWSAVTPLTFTQANAATADIRISWETGDHGDGTPFDGLGGPTSNVLAHAFYPSDGRLHFDDADTWTTAPRTDSAQPIDLVTVAAHELGHSLGLGHSADAGALTYPTYTSSHRYLSSDDVAGIQSLYTPPSADVAAATGITVSSATLHGGVGPNGSATTYHFEYGTTTSYGNVAPMPDAAAGSGTGSVAVQQTVRGLLAGTTYHYRLVATSTNGTVASADATFTTLESSDLIETVYDDGGGAGWAWRSYDLTLTANWHPPIAGNPSAINVNGVDQVYSRSADGHLIATVADGLGGNIWNAYDLTFDSGGSVTIAGDPFAALVGGSASVYAVNAAGHLLEFRRGATRWEVYDVTAAVGGPAIAGRGAVLVRDGKPQVFARTANGALVVHVFNGRSWELHNLTVLTNGPSIAGDPSLVTLGDTIHLYYRTTNGLLYDTLYDQGTDGIWHWSSWEITGASGGARLSGDPSVVVVDGAPQLFAVTVDRRLTLTVWENRSSGGGWVTHDLSVLTGAPGLHGHAAAAMVQDSPRVYVRSATDHLIELVYAETGGSWRWSYYDLTFQSGAVHRSDPTVIVTGDLAHVYTRGHFP